MNELAQFISTVGFPICAFVMVYYRGMKSEEANRQTLEKVTDALNNNTTAIARLQEAINKKEEN